MPPPGSLPLTAGGCSWSPWTSRSAGLTIVEDPFGNRLVLLDSTKGTYDTDESGAVTGVS